MNESVPRSQPAVRAWARRVVAPENRWFTLALLVGLGLRLAWVIWATAASASPLGDTAQHLSMADQFSRLQSYRINGNLSAYHAPGYPFLLAPVTLLARTTGWFSPVFGAALVNVAAGTATIALAATLARRWIGERARTPTAWVLAVAAGPIYLTSAALNETVHTATVLAALLVITTWEKDRGPLATTTLVGAGALIGYSALVRSTGLVLLVVAVIALRRHAGSWRSTLRPAALVVVLALAVLGPWVLRNGLQVGVWAPSGNAAAFLCHGHGDNAEAAEVDLTDAEIGACFVGTAYGPDPDEGRWYRTTVREALAWAVTHPREEVRLTWDKTVAMYADDSQALADAGDLGARILGGPEANRRLDRLADAWHRIVLGLGLTALVISGPARRAWPLWTTVIGLTMAIWAGSALDRYHHTPMAILAVLASATMVTMGRWASAGIRSMGEQEDAEPDDEAPPPPPAEGLARAAHSASRLTGPRNHPMLPPVLAVATGAWVCALGFDVISFASSTEWVYARGAWLLTGLGVLAGLTATFIALADLLVLPRGTLAFQTGLRRLLALDAALVLFTASFLVRNASDFRFHDPSPVGAVVLSLLGLGALGVTIWLGGTLTYVYGVRVALDEERQHAFEPLPEAAPALPAGGGSAADEVE